MMLDIDLLIESEELFMTSLPGGPSFTWRLLTLKEYKVFSTLRAQGVYNDLQLYYEVFDRCYIGEPMAINGNIRAGIFLSIGQLIMYLSGDSGATEAEEIEAARAGYHTAGVLEVMKRVVIMAFSYRPEELEKWTRRKLFRMFVEAEALLQNTSEYMPLDTSKIMTADQIAAQKTKPVVDFNRENKELGDEFGDRKHALDMHPAELEQRANKQKRLKAQQLRQADQSIQHEAQARKKHRRR